MTTKTFYPINAKATGANHMQLQDGGSPPASATTGTGWVVDSLGPPKYCSMTALVETIYPGFGTTPKPDTSPRTDTYGDCWRSENPLTGIFESGIWTFNFPVIAVTVAGGHQDGRVRLRVWKGASATGSDAVELTSATLLGTVVTDLTNATPQISSVTWTLPADALMNNEYLFVQMAWEITGQGNNVNADVLFRVGTDAVITTSEFTVSDWRLHPYTYEGHLFVHKPRPLLQALVNEAVAVTYPVSEFAFDGATLDLLNGHEGADWRWFISATLSLGAAALGRDQGQARLRNYKQPGYADPLYVYASKGVKPGELNVVDNDHVTIWNEFRPWMKPARVLDNSGTVYYIKDFSGYPNPLKDTVPVPNVGPGYAGMADANRYVDLTFDASQGYVTSPCQFWGEPSADQCSGGTASASTVNGGNVAANGFDNNNATYWEATGNTNQWLKYDFGSAKTVRQVRVRNQSYTNAPRNFKIQYSADDVTYTDALAVTNEYMYVTGVNDRDYAIPADHSARYWRIYIQSCNGAARIALSEVSMFIDSGNSIYEWNVGDDGEIITGSASSSAITVRYPVGFRYLHLTIDIDPADGWEAHRLTRHIPIFVGLPKAWDGLETAYTGCTYSASTADGSHPASHAFDGLAATYWTTTSGTLTGWLKVQFPAKRTLGSYAVRAIADNATAAPNDWTFQGSQDDSTWVTLDTQVDQVFAAGELKTYTLAACQAYKYYRLNITSNNGHATLLGLAEFDLMDGTDDDYFDAFTIENRQHTQQGQEMTFRIYDGLDKDDYPDQTLVMYWEDEYYHGLKGSLYGPTDREHVKFIGWLAGDQREEITGGELTTEKATRVTCFDTGRMLGQLPAFSDMVERTCQNYFWGFPRVIHANVDRFVWYLLFWNSTLAELTDFWWSGTGEIYAFPTLSADGGDQWEQLSQPCAAIAHFLTCDQWGRLYMLPDPQLQAVADRTATIIETLTDDDILSIAYTHYAAPRAHWTWGSATQANTQSDDDPALAYTTYFCRVPGQVPGQGLIDQEFNEQLVVDQAELNTREGNRDTARQNPETSYLEIKLAHVGDIGFDPGRVAWVKITLSAENAAQRGLTWTEGRFLLLETQTSYDPEKGTKEVTIIVEEEKSGLAAETYTP